MTARLLAYLRSWLLRFTEIRVGRLSVKKPRRER